MPSVSAPRAAISAASAPVPHPRSMIFSPGCGSSRSTSGAPWAETYPKALSYVATAQLLIPPPNPQSLKQHIGHSVQVTVGLPMVVHTGEGSSQGVHVHVPDRVW